MTIHTNANYASGVNNYLNSNHINYLAQLCGRFFCVLENFRRKFANLVAPPTDITTNPLRVVKHIQSSNSRPKQRPNQCILLSTLSFQKLFKNDQKCGPEFGGLLWRHMTPHRKTAIQVHNYNPPVLNSLKDVLENLLPV